MRTNTLFQMHHLSRDNLYPIYYLANRIANKVASLPSDLACWLNSTAWFEQSVLFPRYQKQLKQHKEYLPRLEVSELAIVEQMEEEGVCITSLEELGIPDSQQLLEAAQYITNELVQLSSCPSHKGKHTLMATAHQLLMHPEVLTWGLSERILKIVECYLGLPVAYGGLSFYYSVANGRDVGPRIWHRDKEDWRMVKVAVYLNDVDEFGGPYQCIKSAVNQWLIKNLSKYQGMIHSELQALLNQDESDWLTSCVGKAGTVIFTDTARCYHRGKPPLKTDRSAIFFSLF